jgi:hypothetical protein
MNIAKDIFKLSQPFALQALAEIDPQLIVQSLPRFVELRNSYQNRPAIGLAILWSVGTAGRRDVGCGVRVWLEVMLPVLQMRHYTRFVVDYLGRLLALHKVTAESRPAKPVMDINNFCTVQVRNLFSARPLPIFWIGICNALHSFSYPDPVLYSECKSVKKSR